MPGPPDEAWGLVTVRKQASARIKPCPIDTTEKKELEVLELDSLVEEVYVAAGNQKAPTSTRSGRTARCPDELRF